MKDKFQKLIDLVLKERDFQVDDYIAKKVIAINNFFAENKLDACVIGLSGGVDSAVVYKLLKLASEQENSPIKKIKPLAMPIESDGTTGQLEAEMMAKLLFKDDSTEFLSYNLTMACHAYIDEFEAWGEKPNAWTKGQIASIVRTPMIYGQAAYLQQLGFNSIVVGTTNRDEGSYIGFFGKASDAMVDLQPIADIHKTEVYEVAKRLGVPNEIIERKPMGDVWDGALDEDTIGAPYWFIQMYLLLKEYESVEVTNLWIDAFVSLLLEPETSEFYYKCRENIEAIHEKNKHKYEVGLPSHFIDVKPRKIKNGWQ